MNKPQPKLDKLPKVAPQPTTSMDKLVTCKHWDYLPAMLVERDRGPGLPKLRVRIPETFTKPADGHVWTPVYDDPATLGLMLALVRRAYREPMLSTAANKWWNGTVSWRLVASVPVSGLPDLRECFTEFDALATALIRCRRRRA